MEIEEHPLPRGWRWARLGEVIEFVQSGFATSERSPSGVIQLRTINVTRDGSLDLNDVLRVPAPDDSSQVGLLPGEIIFNNTNSQELVGRTVIFEGYSEPIYWRNHLSRIRVKPNIVEASWVGHWLHHLWQIKLFSELATRWVGQAAVQKDKLFPLPLPLPPRDEQRRITGVRSE